MEAAYCGPGGRRSRLAGGGDFAHGSGRGRLGREKASGSACQNCATTVWVAPPLLSNGLVGGDPDPKSLQTFSSPPPHLPMSPALRYVHGQGLNIDLCAL